MANSIKRPSVMAMVGFVFASGLGAEQVVPEPDVDAALRCFEAVLFPPKGSCEPGARPADVYVRETKYSAATKRAMLNGLVELALSARDRDLRIAALSYMGSAGSAQSGPQVSVVPFLQRFYAESDDATLRVFAVDHASRQIDTAGAVQFLEAVASEPNALLTGLHISAPEQAVTSLSRLGIEGRSSLQRLVAQDRLPNPRVRARAQSLLLDRNP